MPGAVRTSGPRAATLVAVAVGGIALGAAGAMAAGALSDNAEPDLLLTSLHVPGSEQDSEPGRVTAGLTVNNHGTGDFQVADVRIPGWTLAEPGTARLAIPAGSWSYVPLELVADCSASAPEGDVEIVGTNGRTVVLERAASARLLASAQLRGCLERDTPAPGPGPAVEQVTARTDPGVGVVHVDVDLVHEASAGHGLQLAAVTGRVSGFTVELSQGLAELADGATTTVTTDWRVRDCGSAAGTTDAGEPDLSSSGNFEGLTLHVYRDDPAQSQPMRTDLSVDLPAEVIITLARFAVAECGTDDART